MSVVFCACGCGQPAPVYKGKQRRYARYHCGIKKADPVRPRYRGGVLKHTAIAEKALGKSLPPAAQVHHVNGNGWDNRNANLVICHDQQYHYLLHVRARVLKAGGDPNTERICGTCHRLFPLAESARSNEKHGRLCRECYRVERDARTVRDRLRRLMRSGGGHVCASVDTRGRCKCGKFVPVEMPLIDEIAARWGV